jgi:para-nitrobenzyl esterase
VVLPAEDPLVALGRRGAHADVPVIVGTKRDENKLFMFNDPALVRRWFGIVPRLRDPVSYQVDAISRACGRRPAPTSRPRR